MQYVIIQLFSALGYTIDKHSWRNHGNQGLWFTVQQKGPKNIADLEV
jgi:hypothetical protein